MKIDEVHIRLDKGVSKDSPESQRAMGSIVETVSSMLNHYINEPESNFSQVHPRTLIVMVTVNILFNLFNSAYTSSDLRTKLEAGQAIAEDVTMMFLDVLERIETIKSEGPMQ